MSGANAHDTTGVAGNTIPAWGPLVVAPAPPSLSPAEVAEFQAHHRRAVDLLADAAWLDRLRAVLVPFAAELAVAGASAAGVPAPVAALLVGAVSSVADAVARDAAGSPG